MTGTARIYFDNAATTPPDPRVREAMRPFLNETFANPSSLHTEGRAAREAVEKARSDTATLVGARPSEVVFTSGGTEADNLALVGVALSESASPVHIITSAIEHPAVREACLWLSRSRGTTVSCLPVDSDGMVDPEQLPKLIRAETRLISVMAANNVTGAVQPIRELAHIAHQRGVLFHTDAVQAVGKVPIHIEQDEIDLLSLSAHKLHGPKGIGALIVRRHVRLSPILHGGGQEAGLRSGTENVPGIVGLGEAARLMRQLAPDETPRLLDLRERIIEGVQAAVPTAYVIGHRYRRLPGHVCVGFSGLEGESIRLMLLLDEAGVAVSTGSACSAHKATEPSYVLTAMGFDAFRARGALRVTLGRFNTAEEVDQFLKILPRVVEALSPISRRRVALAGVGK